MKAVKIKSNLIRPTITTITVHNIELDAEVKRNVDSEFRRRFRPSVDDSSDAPTTIFVDDFRLEAVWLVFCDRRSNVWMFLQTFDTEEKNGVSEIHRKSTQCQFSSSSG